MKHKWYNEIVAYANGETVQYRNLDEPNGKWQDYEVCREFRTCFVFDSPNFEHRSLEWRVKPKIVKREGWLNICPVKTGSISAGHLFTSEKYANSFAPHDRIDCIRIEWEEEV